jgi:expansin (peptidoglycan-binding protein)
VRVDYRRVDCPVVGDIAYHIRKESNNYWILVTILNVGGPGSLSKVWVKGSKSSTWIPLTVSSERFTSDSSYNSVSHSFQFGIVVVR